MSWEKQHSPWTIASAAAAIAGMALLALNFCAVAGSLEGLLFWPSAGCTLAGFGCGFLALTDKEARRDSAIQAIQLNALLAVAVAAWLAYWICLMGGVGWGH